MEKRGRSQWTQKRTSESLHCTLVYDTGRWSKLHFSALAPLTHCPTRAPLQPHGGERDRSK